MSVELTQADFAAIEAGACGYINDKGAKFYARHEYEKAIEYYRLSASMGCVQSISNLGYCYMYARSIPQNMSLAMAYFKIAARQNNVDALYKLGDIYKRGAEGIEADEELAIYYYQRALEALRSDYSLENTDYPSLYFAVAKEMMPGGAMMCDLKTAYEFLNLAKRGFEIEIRSGIDYHAEMPQYVEKLLSDPCFDPIRDDFSEYDFED